MRPCLATELVLIGEAAVEAVHFVDLVGVPRADADAVAVHAVEAGPLARAVQRHIIPALVAVEIFQVAVHGAFCSRRENFSEAEMRRPVVGAAVVGYAAHGIVRAVVAGYAAATDASFIIESIVVDLPRHDADAPVVAVAVAVDVVVVAVVFAAAVLDHRAEEELSLGIGKFLREAHVDAEALRIHMGAALRPHGGAAEGRERGEGAGDGRGRALLGVLRLLRRFEGHGVGRLGEALGGQHIRPGVQQRHGSRPCLHRGLQAILGSDGRPAAGTAAAFLRDILDGGDDGVFPVLADAQRVFRVGGEIVRREEFRRAEGRAVRRLERRVGGQAVRVRDEVHGVVFREGNAGKRRHAEGHALKVGFGIERAACDGQHGVAAGDAGGEIEIHILEFI